MKTFYDKQGNVLGHAWSSAIDQCKEAKSKREHEPHSFDPEYAMYGPYMCAGYPRISLYDTPPRKPVNNP